MPILTNARHERFAQALAAGKTADEAYQAAGFKENRGNATRLKANESVEARVEELLGRAAAKAEVTIDTIADMLREDRELARANVQAGAAVRATESLGKLYGMFVDRKEVGGPGDFDNMSADELRASIAGDLEAAGGQNRASATSGRTRESGPTGRPH